MSLYEARNNPSVEGAMGKIAIFLIISLLLWSLGAPTLIKYA